MWESVCIDTLLRNLSLLCERFGPVVFSWAGRTTTTTTTTTTTATVFCSSDA